MEWTYRVLHKKWDKLCLRIMAMLQRVNLYFWGFTDLLLSFSLEGINKKTKECTSIGCSAKFLLGVWNFSLYKFSDLLEKRFCHHSLSYQCFCHQAICIHCLLHTQPNIFIWKKPGHILCADTSDLWGKSFQLSIQQCALCCCHCCGRVALINLSVSGFPCTNGRSFLLQGFRQKTVV